MLLCKIPAAEAYTFVSRNDELSAKSSSYKYWVDKYGLSKDRKDNQLVQTIQKKLLANIKTSWPYNFYVLNSKQINAFDTLGANVFVFTGLIKTVESQPDELAFILGHEIAHQESEHNLRQIDATQKANLIRALIMRSNKGNDNLNLALFVVEKNYLNSGYGAPAEKEADRKGFIYATQGGYNPGAGAAAFVRFRDIFGAAGERDKNLMGFFAGLVNPDPHQSDSIRIQNFGKYMTDYSGGKVKVKGNTIYLNDKAILTCEKINGFTSGEERAYIIAGKLAQITHNSDISNIKIAKKKDIIINGKKLMTCTKVDHDPSALVQAINATKDEDI